MGVEERKSGGQIPRNGESNKSVSFIDSYFASTNSEGTTKKMSSDIAPDQPSTTLKSADLSIKYRKLANELYVNQKYDQSIDHYSLSIVYAPSESAELALALANRSVANEKLENFKDSKVDLKRALHIVENIQQRPINVAKKIIEKWKTRMTQITELSKDDQSTEEDDRKQPLYAGLHPKFSQLSSAVEVGHSAQKGRLLKAAQDIPKGSLIMTENACSWQIHDNFAQQCCRFCCRKLHKSWIPCQNCARPTVRYCDELCRNRDYHDLHCFECGMVGDGEAKKQSDEHPNQTDKELANQYLTEAVHFERVATRLITKTPINQLSDLLSAKSVQSAINDENPDKIDPGFGDNLKSMRSFVQPPNMVLKITPESERFQRNCLSSDRYLKNEKWNESLSIEAKREFICDLLNEVINRLRMNAYTIQSFEFLNGIFGPSDIGTAIFAFGTLLNHSCLSNVTLYFDGRKAEWRTLLDVKAGEELTACYGPRFGATLSELRGQSLKENYCFVCDCEACQSADYRRREAELLSFICEKCQCSATYKLNSGILCLKCRHWQTYSMGALNERLRLSCSAASEMDTFEQVLEHARLFRDVFGENSARFKQYQIVHVHKVVRKYPKEATQFLLEAMQWAESKYHDPSQQYFYHSAALTSLKELKCAGAESEYDLKVVQSHFIKTWLTNIGRKGALQKWHDLKLFDKTTFNTLMNDIQKKMNSLGN